jgi:hypothetical protein
MKHSGTDWEWFNTLPEIIHSIYLTLGKITVQGGRGSIMDKP